MEGENNEKKVLKENVGRVSDKSSLGKSDEAEKEEIGSEKIVMEESAGSIGAVSSEVVEKNKTGFSKYVIIGLVVWAVVLVVVFGMMRGGDGTVTGNDIKSGDLLAESDAAAIVNGEVITVGELNEAFNSLPPQYAGSVSKSDLLNQLVQGEVFYQEAEKQGLALSEDEARKQFELAKLSSGISEEQFSASLVAKGVTEDELISQYKKQLTIQEFINSNLLDKIQISDEDVEEYYSSNSEQFQVGEQVVVKHILIGDENLTAEEKDAKAKELLPKLTQKNFCEFVSDYSTDTASVPTCGEYAFTMKDPLVEEFKNLSFSQKTGEIGTVKTQFGTHIIWTVKKTPAKEIELEEVSDSISEFLKSQKGQEQYVGFYEGISKGSVIEIKYAEI